jgi:ParB-like chromosome segregation protein Spo0J
MTSKKVNVSTIVSNKQYELLLPPMADEDYERLKSSIKTEGVRDPVIIWEGQNVLIDGYNRISACHDLDIRSVPAIFMSFPGTHDVERWIITNQLSRRNLTDEQRVRYIGMLVKGLKKTHGGVRKYAGRGGGSKESSRQNDDLKSGRAVENVAKDMGISSKTAERADNFDTAVTRIGKVSPDAAAKIMAGKARHIVGKGAIEKLANAPDEDIKKAAKAIDQGKPIVEKKPKAAKPRDVAECDLFNAVANIDTQVDVFAKLIKNPEKKISKEHFLLIYEQLGNLTAKIDRLGKEYIKTWGSDE